MACAIIICSFTSVHAKVLPKTANLVPAETVLLVEVDNFSRLKTQFEKTNLYKLYKDPAMAAFFDNLKTKWQERIRQRDNEIAKAIVNADILPQGRVAVSLVLDKQAIDSNEPTLLCITQWGDNTTKIKEAVDKTVEKAIEKGSHRKTQDYRGVSIKTIIDEHGTAISYSFVDDCLIVSDRSDLVEFVIAHIKGAKGPTLADNSDYTAAIAATGPHHDIDLYVNIKQIIKTIIAENSTGWLRSAITNLGVDNVASLSCSIGLARCPGSSYCGKTAVKINGAKKGICKMLEFESAASETPRFIPASAYSATFLNLDIKKVYSELANILYSFEPMLSAWMYTPLPTSDSADEPGLKIKDDIIDYLGSQILVAQSVDKPFSKTSMPHYLVAFAVNDRIALEKSLSLLHRKMTAANNREASRELLGHTIYLVMPPQLPQLPGNVRPMQGPADSPIQQRPELAFTITDTYLIFGAESTVERAIRTLSSSSTASVASSSWFSKAKSAIPSLTGFSRVEDNSTQAEILWWMMKQSGKADGEDTVAAAGPGMMFPQIGKDLFDFSLLPEFDAVKKYFGVGASYGLSRPDGFFFEFKDINPAIKM